MRDDRVTEGDKARVRAMTVHGANLWLTTIPTSPSLELRSEDFEAAMRMRLGLLPRSVRESKCPCGRDDDASNHFFNCTHSGERKTAVMRRHDMYAKKLGRVAEACGMAVRYEQSVYDLDEEKKDQKRADVRVETMKGPVLVDVAVVNPTTATARRRAAVEALSEVKVRERNKRAKYNRRDDPLFVPFVVDAYGAMGAEAAKFVRWVHEEDDSISMSQRLFAERILAMVLQRGNALIYKVAKRERLAGGAGALRVVGE